MVLVLQHTKYLHFCPRCGKPTEYNPARGGLCIDCYLEIHREKIPKNLSVEITVCAGCGEIKYGDKWYDPSISNFISIISRHLRKSSIRVYDHKLVLPSDFSVDLQNYQKLVIPIKIAKGGDELVEKPLTIHIQHAFCPLCSKKTSGKYYESIIHLRFSKKNEQRVFQTVQLFVDRFMESAEKLETIDIKKDGAHGLVLRYSNKRTAKKFIENLKKNFSIIIYQQYKEPILINITKKQMRINVEKYFIRIV